MHFNALHVYPSERSFVGFAMIKLEGLVTTGDVRF